MKWIYFILLMSYSSLTFGQNSRVLMHFSYGVEQPVLDLSQRFGTNYNPGLDFDIFSNRKFFYGIHGHMLLGPFVKEDVISNLRNRNGNLLSQQQSESIITMKMRGFLGGIHGGRFFNISNGELAHGPRIRVGTSYFSHYIIFNNETQDANQLLGEYRKGYNRLSRGITIEEFVGYQFINSQESLNLFCGFTFTQGFTRGIRPVNFDTRQADNSWRNDFMIGFRAGFTINIFEFGTSTDEVFY